MTWLLWGLAGLFAFVKIAERVVTVQKAKRETLARQARRRMAQERVIEMGVHEEPMNTNAPTRGPRRRAHIGTSLSVGRLDRASNIAPTQENIQ